MKILHNHIGYALGGAKRALVQSSATLASHAFTLYRCGSREAVFSGTLRPRGAVAQWRDWQYWEADFSALQTTGEFFLALDGAQPPLVSQPFGVSANPFDSQLLSDLLHYLKSQRCSGVFDEADRACPVFGSDARVDVHGGWYDASGDCSKYLSHLSYANVMNPQQTPQLVWNLIEGRSRLVQPSLWFDERIVDEALHGADFLRRMQHPDGAFYMTVFDRWSKDVAQRRICSYTTQQGHLFATWQAGWRQGGGSAIAALARASRLPRDGEFSRAAYLDAAQRGFAHLERHGSDYLADGAENIIDDYCALLAATELAAACGEAAYARAAELRAERLIARQHPQGWFWADDAKTRSYFHAVEAGLPYVALMRFLDVLPEAAPCDAVRDALQRGLACEIEMTARGANNPFGYPRQQVVRPGHPGGVRFFIPHDNESGYWWQGENARLASLACAARAATRYLAHDEALCAALRRYAQGALDWIFGFNPFDACMMQGQGHRSPRYERGYWNAPGGVCNGITGGLDNEDDIDFRMPGETDPTQSWRWSEQWLPHAAWLFAALAHGPVENS
ncbi:glycoside hydrolase family 9 protein [Piscinibacter sp.]|uniref:glycoside hydrolase family 9 protein n=1 Tax=Piscinibacter sp. TaxID=1903157 RepID=UPI002F3E4946